MPSRQQLSRLTLIIDSRLLGQWDDKTGGGTDSNTVQYFAAGGGPRISLGGSQQVDNLVVSALETDYIASQAKWLTGRCGKGKGTFSQQRIDDDGNPIGDPFGWNVLLKKAALADVQSQSNSASVFQVELEVNGAMF